MWDGRRRGESGWRRRGGRVGRRRGVHGLPQHRRVITRPRDRQQESQRVRRDTHRYPRALLLSRRPADEAFEITA